MSAKLANFKPYLKGFVFLFLAILSLVFVFVVFMDGRKQVISFTPKLQNEDPERITIIATGDVMLGRTVMIEAEEKEDPIYPFRKVADKLREADLVFINLENPIIPDCPKNDSGFKFCADPKMVAGLTFAGVDVASLANNHSGNYGKEGINETVKILEENGILVTGLGDIVIKQYRNMSFGFLGFDFTVDLLNDADLELITSANEKADVVIVGVHWGVEYTDKPTRKQREWAKEMVDAGADVIIGHHPHWVQNSEIINGVPVYYSLGNFIFDQMWSEKTKKGLVVDLMYRGGRLFSSNLYRSYISEIGQPVFSSAYLGE